MIQRQRPGGSYAKYTEWNSPKAGRITSKVCKRSLCILKKLALIFRPFPADGIAFNFCPKVEKENIDLSAAGWARARFLFALHQHTASSIFLRTHGFPR
jgi:hypothetical protein